MKYLILLIFPIMSFAQNDIDYEKLTQMSDKDFAIVIEKNIKVLESGELWNLLHFVDTEFDLEPFNESLIRKLESSEYPFDLYFLTKFLLRTESNKKQIENSLNQKLQIWSSGEWSEKFWKLIREHRLNIDITYEFYSINEEGEKKYDLSNYLNYLRNSKTIGLNPIIMIDYEIVSYPKNKLYETLSELKIKDMKVLPIQISIKLFGKEGSDGAIKILSRE